MLPVRSVGGGLYLEDQDVYKGESCSCVHMCGVQGPLHLDLRRCRCLGREPRAESSATSMPWSVAGRAKKRRCRQPPHNPRRREMDRGCGRVMSSPFQALPTSFLQWLYVFPFSGGGVTILPGSKDPHHRRHHNSLILKGTSSYNTRVTHHTRPHVHLLGS